MKHPWRIAGALVLVGMGLSACKQAEVPRTQTALLAVSQSPLAIEDDGEATTIRVSAFNADGTPGTGTVSLTAAAGSFGNGESSIDVQLESGKASTTFSCDAALDPYCAGNVRIEGIWNAIIGRTTVQVRGPAATPDAGTGGTPDGGSGGTPDGGSDTPTAGPPAGLVYVAEGAREQVGLRSSGRETTSAVTFQVVDLNGLGVPDVTVAFTVAGAGGATVTPTSATTDAEGVVRTTLVAGDEVGMAIVTAGVATPALRLSAPGIPVVGALPSDEGFQVQCVDINLAANASVTPPRMDVSTSCHAVLVDRFKNPVALPTPVTWYAEAGAIESPVLNDDAGRVQAAFSTFGKYPPADVAPNAGELAMMPGGVFPDARNPRDMLVTVIAVTSGEEEFYDGSGLSNGQKDGKWNPGEWFVDLPEPFVDENDNQQYDPGEAFIDTERLSCATGQREARNGRWDGPNGCWDSDTQLWRPAHLLYSGAVAGRVLVSPVPSPLALETTYPFEVRFFDAYFNAIAPDGADVTPVFSGKRGSMALGGMVNGLTERFYGFGLFYERLATTPSGAGYTTTGACDPTAMPPPEAEAQPGLARCVREYRFGAFDGGNIAVLELTGAETPTEDGSATSATLSFTVQNAFFSPTKFPLGSTTVE